LVILQNKIFFINVSLIVSIKRTVTFVFKCVWQNRRNDFDSFKHVRIVHRIKWSQKCLFLCLSTN